MKSTKALVTLMVLMFSGFSVNFCMAKECRFEYMSNLVATSSSDPNTPNDQYIADVTRRIKRLWRPPQGKESEEIVVAFKIWKKKNVVDSDIRVLKSSNSECTNVAVKAVENASRRFRPLPERFGSGIEVTLTFNGELYRTSGTESNVTWKRLQDNE